MIDATGLTGAVVLSVGDVILDEYLWGEVRRISPEAPVPVVEIHDRTHAAGGAANVAAGVAALGGQAHLAGVVGDDAPAELLRSALGAAGVAAQDLLVDRARPTTSKTRIRARSQQIVRADREDTSPLTNDLETELIRRVTGRIAEVDAVVISDYRKGVVSQRLARAVIDAAASNRTPVVVDPKGVDYASYRGASVITPNVHDAGVAASIEVESDEDLVRVAARLSHACGGVALLITRGAAGMSLFEGDRRLDVPARARAIYDLTGAGDTVSAILAVALANAIPLREAVTLANAGAGVAVGKVGTATVTLTELEASLQDCR